MMMKEIVHMRKKRFNVAVAGATGAVGNQMITCLEEADFPVTSIRLLASARSLGRKLRFRGDLVDVEQLTEKSFTGMDIALFSAGGSTSEQFAPIAAKAGCVVIDNSSAWRMDAQVPLVVPEVNPHAVAQYTQKGIIANPNCSTIQMVVALSPIHRHYGIRRIVVSTYQSVSGTGKKAIEELFNQTRAMINFLEAENRVYPHRIAFNCLPHIDKFLDNGYTKEEMKMVNETAKMLDPAIKLTATTVRIPVANGHSESVNVEFERPYELDELRALLAGSPGIVVEDDPARNLYPLPTRASGKDPVYVGRLRRDFSCASGLNFWCVADNLRKGAALNTAQIAELLAAEFGR
jgi:aspartate-semialdehyde dehydrogenase